MKKTTTISRDMKLG